jgi:diguanylate cyclase (GGDEF)-like protein
MQHRLQLAIAPKFFLVVAVLVPVIVLVGWFGISGLSDIHRRANDIYGDNLHVVRLTTDLGKRIRETEADELRLTSTREAAEGALLEARLVEKTIPAVEGGIRELQALSASDSRVQPAPIRRIADAWRAFLRLRASGALDVRARARRSHADPEVLTERIVRVVEPVAEATYRVGQSESVEAAESHAAADRAFHRNTLLILFMLLAALVTGVGAVMWLIRAVVPRVREYSRFATQVAAGNLSNRLAPRGADELTDLGHALNEIVDRRVAVRGHEALHAEFSETLQLTESETEAHQLLKQQLERSVPESRVVVLNRNNSADRLEATTTLPDASPLTTSLEAAKPRSCLAVRFARAHSEGGGQNRLLSCEVCGKTAQQTTCEPLFVSGEVIGSVLVEHALPLSAEQSASISASVTQAAPVLANLRNLAIAEMRAATDVLTGLPNNRSVQDTIKRMVAYASRSASPLAAVLLDLDHFKQINDTFGHRLGDDVLAAVGAVLESTLRDSDFVGRYGGEEFVLLMPSTSGDNAFIAAEKVRSAIAAIRIPGVDRPITASLGVAILPDNAGEAVTLIRSADRALYVAKSNGRNRVERAVATPSHRPEAVPA